MEKYSSFISEHTAEYVLINSILNIFHKRFEFVSPIFPWITREGSNISQYLHSNDKFKILGIYPRRPKYSIHNINNFIIKISEDIVISGKTGRDIGIPIIAGCPIVRNFWDLGNNPQCIWINILENKYPNLEISLEKNNLSESTKKKYDIIFKSEEDILSFFQNTSKELNIDEAIESFKAIKMSSKSLEYYNPFLFQRGYKPFYLLIK
jgi:hypothetical protein